MASVREVLDRLAAGQITLDAAADDFRSRSWPKLPTATDAEVWGVHDPAPAPEDSWDVVNSDSRLTSDQYAKLAEAYTEAVKRPVKAAGSDDPGQPTLF